MEQHITDSYRFAIVGLGDKPFQGTTFNMHWMGDE